ncbi:MAG: 6-bladed beta-propeller [Gemmatimonadota bacterium]|nr:6-bladed beta-propeller [Gemmatimonadota bacterium]
MPFEAAFELIDSVALNATTRDPIADPIKVVRWGPRFAVLDQIQGNVKVFDPSGSWLRSVGRPGDGPGEFRRVSDMVVIRDDMLIVLDVVHRSLSTFDSAGVHQGDVAIGGYSLGALERIVDPDGKEWLAVGATPGGAGNGVHILDLKGEYLETIVDVADPGPPRNTSFGAVSIAVQDQCVVVGRVYSDTVHLYDPWEVGCGGRSRPGGVPLLLGGPEYFPPAWPRDQRALGSEEMLTWSQSQIWLMDVFALGELVIAELVTADPTERVLYYQYVVGGSPGGIRAATTRSEQRIVGVQSDTVYTIGLSVEGNARLRTYRLR